MNADNSSLLFNKYLDVQSFCTDAFDIIQEICATSNALPEAGEEFDYYQSYQQFVDVMALNKRQLLTCINWLLRSFTSSRCLDVSSKSQSIDDYLDRIIEANDEMLERISNELDEASGLKKHSTTSVEVQSTWKNPAVRFSSQGMVPILEITSRFRPGTMVIAKPQEKFRDRVDNSYMPFVPKIRDKPYAITPLSSILRNADDMVIDDLLMDRHPEILEHPYVKEIDSFTPSDSCFEVSEVQEPVPLDDNPFIYVNDEAKLNMLVEDLQSSSEIAVDLEHHHLRSFLGFTCLMQISSRQKDYIIDALELREEMKCLNKIFANPAILKVFHGADLDVIWLQKDFGLYVINMFDTHQAAKLLNLPYSSLSYLLKHYCNVDAQKQYQRADWRIRPLPLELLNYARCDTHYLLYIYDIMRNQLIASGNARKNLIRSVYERSKAICKKQYVKPIFDAEDYVNLTRGTSKMFNARQNRALKLLYAWRDKIARADDESTEYIIPNHMLLKIAEFLPKEKQGILACCNPIPVYVRQNLVELHQIICEARDIPLTNATNGETVEDKYVEMPVYDPNSMLNTVHDITHTIETTSKEYPDFRSLKKSLKEVQLSKAASRSDMKISDSPKFSILFSKEKLPRSTAKLVVSVMAQIVNPFARYLPAELLTPSEKLSIKIKFSSDDSKWKLLPPLPVKTLSEETENTPHVEVLPTPAEIHNADDVVPLRRLTKKKKPTVAENPSCEEPANKKSKVETSFPAVPFDYASVDYNRFGGALNTEQQNVGTHWKESKNQFRWKRRV